MTDLPGKGIEEVAKQLVPEVYKDAAQPAVREVGSALGRAVRIALAPVRGLAWSWERAESWLEGAVSERLERRKLAPDRVTTPNLQLTAGAIRGVQAAGPEADPTLRDLFAGLLATSMDASRSTEVHPAFAEILSNMTSDEARLIQQLARRSPAPLVRSASIHVARGFVAVDEESLMDAEVLSDEVEFSRAELLQSYLDNLTRLGLIRLHTESFEPRPPRESDRSPEQEGRRRQLLAYLDRYGLESAKKAHDLFHNKSRELPWTVLTGARVRITLRLVWATAFGNQLLRATVEPDELGVLADVTDDDLKREAEAEAPAALSTH